MFLEREVQSARLDSFEDVDDVIQAPSWHGKLHSCLVEQDEAAAAAVGAAKARLELLAQQHQLAFAGRVRRTDALACTIQFGSRTYTIDDFVRVRGPVDSAGHLSFTTGLCIHSHVHRYTRAHMQAGYDHTFTRSVVHACAHAPSVQHTFKFVP